MKRHSSFSFWLCLILTLLIIVPGCFKDLPANKVVYYNDFETNTRNNLTVISHSGTVDSAKIFSFNGNKVFGNFNNNRIELDIDKLPEHNVIHIEFDLYIHDEWQGNYLIPGGSNIPDAWQMVIDGYPLYITTFSNSIHGQAFPNNYTPGQTTNPARSNSWNTNLPGVCLLKQSPNGSSLYKIDLRTAHTASALKLACNDVLQPFNSFCNKSWSIDNIKLTAMQYR